MGLSGLTVLGGKAVFPGMTKMMAERSPIQYKTIKAHAWLQMLKQGQRPVTWYAPTKQGTRVKFEIIRSEEMARAAMEEFQQYIEAFNREHPESRLEIVRT